jgi:hypothetical protein
MIPIYGMTFQIVGRGGDRVKIISVFEQAGFVSERYHRRAGSRARVRVDV